MIIDQFIKYVFVPLFLNIYKMEQERTTNVNKPLLQFVTRMDNGAMFSYLCIIRGQYIMGDDNRVVVHLLSITGYAIKACHCTSECHKMWQTHLQTQNQNNN